jgi:hypothetical protein
MRPLFVGQLAQQSGEAAAFRDGGNEEWVRGRAKVDSDPSDGVLASGGTREYAGRNLQAASAPSAATTDAISMPVRAPAMNPCLAPVSR